jgi:hypothetical protein
MRKLSFNRFWQGTLAIAGFFLLWHFASGVFVAAIASARGRD